MCIRDRYQPLTEVNASYSGSPVCGSSSQTEANGMACIVPRINTCPVTHCSRAPANTAPPKNKKSKKSFRIIPSIFFEVSYLKDNNKILIHSLNRQNITLPFRHPGRQQGTPDTRYVDKQHPMKRAARPVISFTPRAFTTLQSQHAHKPEEHPTDAERIH